MNRERALKYIIVTPPHQEVGGAIALHALCKYLTDIGQNAKVFYYSNALSKKTMLGKLVQCFARDILRILQLGGYKGVPEENGVQGCKVKHTHIIGENTVVIYPETYPGNIMHAKNVVRWLLYHYQFEGDSTAYSDTDLFIAYREVFNSPRLNPAGHVVTCSWFNLDFYKRTNFSDNREGTCYIVRKGRNRADLPTHLDGPVIDALPERENVACFNKYKYCVSYDTQTAYSGIAALCGCISIVVPEPGKGRGDYLTGDEKCYGRAFGFSPEEIEFAVSTTEKLREQYSAVAENGRENARRFVEICEEYFGRK